MAFYFSVTAAGTAAAIAAQMWRNRRQGESGIPARNDQLFYIILVLLSLLPYFLTMGLRYAIGTDYFNTYVPVFERAKNGNFTTEIGFQLLMRLVLFFTEDPTGLFLLSACIIVGLTGKGIWECSALPWVSILLFAADRHFFISMNGMRQYMSLAVVMGGVRYIREKCLWKYMLVVLAASLFHMSILIFLPLGLLMYLKINPVVGGGLVAVLTLLQQPIKNLITWAVSHTRYAYYYTQGKYLADTPDKERLIYLFVILAIASVLYQRNKEDAEYRFLYGLELLVFYLAFNRMITIHPDRISWSLEFFHLLLIPKMIMSCKTKHMRWIVGTVCVGACLVFCYYEIFYLGYHAVIPYQSIFSAPQPIVAAA